MKVLILVQSTDHIEYQPLIKAQQETWDSISHADITTIYYQPAELEENLEGSLLKIAHNKRGDNAFFVLMKALRYLRNKEWDYVVKTDNSVYINKEELYKLLSSKPREKYFGGIPITYNNLSEESKKNFPVNIKFLWGEFFVLSKDVAMHLVNIFNKAPFKGVGSDDINVSNLLMGFCPWDESLEITFDENKDTGYCYRVRKEQLDYSPLFSTTNNLRSIITSDIKIMNHIHTTIHGKANNRERALEEAQDKA